MLLSLFVIPHGQAETGEAKLGHENNVLCRGQEEENIVNGHNYFACCLKYFINKDVVENKLKCHETDQIQEY